MIIERTVRALAVVGASAVVVLAGVPVSAAVPPVRTIAAGLDGPMGLDVLHARRALVAESVSGKVTSVDLSTGVKTVLISGLARPAGVASWFGKIFVAQGVPGPGEPAGPKPIFPPASILKADKHGKYVRVHADLMAYELKHNPDGQKQFAPDGKPYDASPATANAGLTARPNRARSVRGSGVSVSFLDRPPPRREVGRGRRW